MFYTHAILSKRGPLARLWLAAHWDRKLTKAQIFETDIQQSCESILEPCLKLALRTKGHLLLGVVRIYSRKTKYLLADVNEAFIKIKMAFRPGIAEVGGSTTTGDKHHGKNHHLITDAQEVSIAAITLPDNFHDFDMLGLDIDYIDDPSRFQLHQARAEEITLKEDFVSVPLPLDDDFGEGNGLEDHEFFRRFQPSLRYNSIDKDSTMAGADVPVAKDSSAIRPQTDDGYDMDGFGEIRAPPSVISAIGIGGDNSNFDQFDQVMSPFRQDDHPLSDEQQPPGENLDITAPDQMEIGGTAPFAVQNGAATTAQQHIPGADDTTLLSNVSDEFVLPPIATTVQAPAVKQPVKRKRKLVIDEVKEIDSASMKTQLSDTTDIVGVLELAPPTRRLMHWKETGGVEKLFTLTATNIFSKSLQQLVHRNMLTKAFSDMPRNNFQQQYDELQSELEHEEDETTIEQMRAAQQAHADSLLAIASANHQQELAAGGAVQDTSMLGASNLLPLPDLPPIISPPQRRLSTGSKKRGFSATEEEQQDAAVEKRQRVEETIMAELPPIDNLLPPITEDVPLLPPLQEGFGGPMTTHMDNLMDVIPAPPSPTRKSARKAAQELNQLPPSPSRPPPSTRRKRGAAAVHAKENQEEQDQEEEDDQGQATTAQEDFESGKKLSRRGKAMMNSFERSLDTADALSFHDYLSATTHVTRKASAQKFYTLLVLKKLQAVDVEQAEPFGDVTVTKAANFYQFVSAR